MPRLEAPLDKVPHAEEIIDAPIMIDRTPEAKAHTKLELAKQELSKNLQRVKEGDWNSLRIQKARGLLQEAAGYLDNHDDEKAARLRQAAVNLTRFIEDHQSGYHANDEQYNAKKEFARVIDEIKLIEV